MGNLADVCNLSVTNYTTQRSSITDEELEARAAYHNMLAARDNAPEFVRSTNKMLAEAFIELLNRRKND